MLRVFGHGLCAWRYSNPALNPWSAPWMLRIGDRLPSTRSKSNRPTVMHLNGLKMPSAGDSTNDSALMGADRVRGSLGECRISQPNGLPHSWIAAPAAQLLSSGYSAPKPICCGPEGRRWFSESPGVASPCSTPWRRGCCLHLDRWAFPGRSFPRSRGGPVSHWGSCPRECCVRRVAAQPCTVGWLAERPDSGQTIWSHCGMRVQLKCACVRPDRGSLTSHQDRTAQSMFGPCPPSTVHLQSTLITL